MHCQKYNLDNFFNDGNSSWKISGNTRVRTTPDHMTFWWGTAMWSIYDKWMKRFVIIGASLTD